MRHRTRDALDPAAAPCPDRRTDEVDRRNPDRADAALEPQIEVRRIDADERIRPLAAHTPQQLPADTRKLAIALQRVDVTVHREPLARPQRVEAFGLHLRPADTEEFGVGQLLPDRADQVAGEQVPGGLARHHRDADGHRLSGRRRAKTTTGRRRTARLPHARPRFRRSACAPRRDSGPSGTTRGTRA